MNAELDLGDDFEITQTTRRNAGNGTWVDGTLNGHRFQALVFEGHAESESYELGDSRISKLWIQRIADRKKVFDWDRGPVTPAAGSLAGEIADFLCAGLAERIYGH